LPSVSLPIGFNKKGFPIGIQIIAKQSEDLKLFAFAKKYEEIFQYNKKKPLLS
jgi:amidase